MAGPIDRYKPCGFDETLGYFVEECGEAMAAAGKTLRWGLDSFNPELPVGERETNEEWLLREMADVEVAIQLLREEIKARRGGRL